MQDRENRRKQTLEHGRSSINEEYQGIRSEILQWQTVRFTLITISAAVVPAIISIVLKGFGSIPEQFVAYSVLCLVTSVLLLLFLLVAVVLTWFAGIGNVKMGSYIAVFYEEEGKGWHHRHSVVKSLSKVFADKVGLDMILSCFYAVLGIASFSLSLLPFYISPEDKLPNKLYILLVFSFVVLVVLLSFAVRLLLSRRVKPDYYRALWRIIKNAETVGIKSYERDFKAWLWEDPGGWFKNTSPEKKMEEFKNAAEDRKVSLDIYIQRKLRTDYKKESTPRRPRQ